MAMDDRRIDLDGSFVIRFLQDPVGFWTDCVENREALFLKPYQSAYRKSPFRLFEKSSREYTIADFPAVLRQSLSGEQLIVVFLPTPEEPVLSNYHIAYGISCLNRKGITMDYRMHVIKHNPDQAPAIFKVERSSQEQVLIVREDRQNQQDMLWRAAFGNLVDPFTDLTSCVDTAGKPGYQQVFSPTCEKMPENNFRGSITIDLNAVSWKQVEKIDLSDFKATHNIFGSSLPPQEEEKQKKALAARHHCSPDEIRLGWHPNGGAYSIARGGGGHYTYMVFDENHKCIWAENISGHPGE